MVEKKKICIVGSGNWGSVIAKIVGNNVTVMPDKYEKEVTMYVYEEMIDGIKLTDIINTKHENVKYLPGYKLPENVVAVPDVVTAASNADILIFVVPHQFVKGLCLQLKGNIKKGVIAVSLIKGFITAEGGGIQLISEVIRQTLTVPCAVLMGANIANEVAKEQFCESTLGCVNDNNAEMLKAIFQTSYFRISYVSDEHAVEVCGALKNIVAVGIGFLDGLDYGENTKAAVIRLGLMEMVRFCDEFYPGAKIATFFESCGIADLITTCFGGRNRKVSEAFVRTGKTIQKLEEEMLNGQQLQGPLTADEVFFMLKSKNKIANFPLFVAIYQICHGELPVGKLLDSLKNHPEHLVKQ